MSDSQTHGSTLFVRNLPFTATNEELENLFSEVGPLKECFVVKDQGETEKCKGFGYVKFGLREDAESAVKKTFKLGGRKLQVIFANRKEKKKKGKNQREDGETSTEKTDVQRESTKPHVKAETVPKKATPMCTVVLSGIEPDTSSDEVTKLVSGLRQFSKLVYPAEDRPETTALVVFHYKNDAAKAVKKLNQAKLRGKALKAILQSDEMFVRKLEKKARLIIRNLSFKCQADDLQKIFSKFGEVTDTSIPKKPDGKLCGYAFISFKQVPAAAKALQAVNGTQIHGRPVAVDWAVARERYKEMQQKAVTETEESQMKPEESSEDSGNASDIESEDSEVASDDESATSVSDSGSESSGEVHTQTHKQTTRKTEEDSGSEAEEASDDESATSEEEEEESDSDSSDEEEDKEESEDSEAEMEASDEETESDASEEDTDSDSDMDSSDDESVKKKKKGKHKSKSVVPESRRNDVEEGKTLFIRNISFDTEEEDVGEAFEKYGDLVYCRLVMDKDTEHSKGCAFVKFKNKEDAEKCLTAASADSEEGGIQLDKRDLVVTPALPREKAEKLREMKKDKIKEDKRNLYLAREGLIRPGTQAAQGLSQADLNRRMKVEAIKRQKLKNPNIFISKTRICVRNIPVSVTDKQLRKIYLCAAENKAAKITECRIMRDMTQVNSKGIAKSRGYAFINFSEHQYALNALRETNNNPAIFGEKKRLIVEFSLENKAALQLQEKRKERLMTKHKVNERSADAQGKKTKGSKNKKEDKALILDSNKVDELISEHAAKKGPKGLPTHWGPKVRHKPRPQVPRVKGKQQGQGHSDRQRGQQVQPKVQGQKRSVQESSEDRSSKKSPKKKRRGNKRVNETDDFDKLVAKYRKNLSAAVKRPDSKWYS